MRTLLIITIWLLPLGFCVYALYEPVLWDNINYFRGRRKVRGIYRGLKRRMG